MSGISMTQRRSLNNGKRGFFKWKVVIKAVVKWVWHVRCQWGCAFSFLWANIFFSCQERSHHYHTAFGYQRVTIRDMWWLMLRMRSESKPNRIHSKPTSSIHIACKCGKFITKLTWKLKWKSLKRLRLHER